MKKANWIAFASLILTIILCMVGGVSWSYTTFVPVRERDQIKAGYDKRLDTFDSSLSRLDGKLDRLDTKLDELRRDLRK